MARAASLAVAHRLPRPAGDLQRRGAPLRARSRRVRAVPTPTIAEAIAAAASGQVDAAFVPLENSSRGRSTSTLDQLIFDVDLLIEREVVLEIHLDLLCIPGATAPAVTTGATRSPQPPPSAGSTSPSDFPGARSSRPTRPPMRRELSPSRMDSTRRPSRRRSRRSCTASRSSATRSRTTPGTRRASPSSARDSVPRPTGHDRTTIVCFQRANRPGSLAEISARFAARGVNLTRIESRPTKQGLGDYCFVIEFEGHIVDEIVGDCLRELHMVTGRMKFLGSYPVPADDRRGTTTGGGRTASVLRSGSLERRAVVPTCWESTRSGGNDLEGWQSGQLRRS